MLTLGECSAFAGNKLLTQTHHVAYFCSVVNVIHTYIFSLYYSFNSQKLPSRIY